MIFGGEVGECEIKCLYLQKNYIIRKNLMEQNILFIATKLYVWTFYYYASKEYLIMK